MCVPPAKEDLDQGVQFTHSGTETTQATFIFTPILFPWLKWFYIHFSFSHIQSLFKKFLHVAIMCTLYFPPSFSSSVSAVSC